MNNNKQSSKEKVFVIGIDGATFDLIKPWVKEGSLPNLSRIMREGAFGELRSTIPTNSAPAWTSFVTGTKPCKHGILHFKSLGCKTEEYLMNSKSRRCKAIWNILSENGKKVGIINVPLTYPPEEVNGFMISGMVTPSRKNTFTFPEDIYHEIKEKVGDYEVEAQLADLVRIRNDKDRQRFIDAVMHTMELRFRAAKYLMDHQEWDFFLVVFIATDRFQHRFWKFMDKEHPHYDPKEAKIYENVIFNVYKRMDEIVGDLFERLDDDTTLIIMSDHGFGPAPTQYVDMKKWLASQGLLSFRKSAYGGKGFSPASFILRKLQLYTPLKLRHYLRARFRSRVDNLQLASRLDHINWASTKVYTDEHVEIFSSIWINLKGREPYGIVEPGAEYERLLDDIISLLKEIRDPIDSQKMVDHIFKRGDIFEGYNSHKAPDLIVQWRNDAYRTQGFSGSKKSEFVGEIERKETSQTISGEHKSNGIFLIRGKNIKRGVELMNAEIIDIVPTIFYRMGVPIPTEIDGKVLVDSFEKDYLIQRPIDYDDAGPIFPESDDDEAFSEEESKEVRDRLRSLGYLE